MSSLRMREQFSPGRPQYCKGAEMQDKKYLLSEWKSVGGKEMRAPMFYCACDLWQYSMPMLAASTLNYNELIDAMKYCTLGKAFNLLAQLLIADVLTLSMSKAYSRSSTSSLVSCRTSKSPVARNW